MSASAFTSMVAVATFSSATLRTVTMRSPSTASAFSTYLSEVRPVRRYRSRYSREDAFQSEEQKKTDILIYLQI